MSYRIYVPDGFCNVEEEGERLTDPLLQDFELLGRS